MKLSFEIESIIKPYERVHFVQGDKTIFSKFNKIYYSHGLHKQEVILPVSFMAQVVGYFRILRRFLRFDKMNVIEVPNGLIVIWRGSVYKYCVENQYLKRLFRMKLSSNIMHGSYAISAKGSIYFGEYSSNSNRDSVPIYCIDGTGDNWTKVYEFKEKTIRHIHGCFYDKYEEKIWVLTGDNDGECGLFVADEDFKNIEKIGDGSQLFRACSLVFTKEKVNWIMDSPLEDVYQIEMDRKTREIKKTNFFPGSVFYIKQLDEQGYLTSTVQETGPSIKDRFVHLYYSRDLYTWIEIAKFKHDGLPKGYFKFGAIHFSHGRQTKDDFYFFAEAVKKYDGKVLRCKINIEEELVYS